MSTVTKPIILDSTGHAMVEALERQNLLLAQMIAPGSAASEAELLEIHHIVQRGEAADFFSIGDQLLIGWNDGTSDYVLPWDIVAFRNVELEDGETRPGMVIQSHYALQAVQFSASQAIYVAQSALPPGTYHFTIGTSWGTHCVKDKVYQFTTTVEVPVGGQIVIGKNNDFYTWAAPDTAVSNWRAFTFASASSTTALESNLALTEGSGGTDLGTVSSTVKYNANGFANLQSCAYGYNRWAYSAIRKQMNSSAAAGAWWSASYAGDRPPQQLSTVRGMMAGFSQTFLNIINPVKVVTALNSVSDSDIGTTETTYDRFFLPSLEEEYIAPQLADAEGPYWPYWKERLGLESPQPQGSGYPNAAHIRYGYNAKTTAQYCRLRSASRSSAYTAWYVTTTGYAGTSAATNAARGCPACVIC